MLKFEKKLTKQFFLVFTPSPPPKKNQSWSVAAILNFNKILKKSPAHLHIMGIVIVEFE